MVCKIEFNTEWGNYSFEPNTVEMIKCLADQLQFYLDNNRTKNREYAETDLRGYKILIEKNDNELIRKFMDTKTEMRKEKIKFNNLMVLERIGIDTGIKE